MVRGEVGGELESGLAEAPLAKAVKLPGGEILLGDRLTLEELGDDSLNFGEGIKPFEQGRARFGVVESSVELVTNGSGEMGDFAGHGGRRIRAKL